MRFQAVSAFVLGACLLVGACSESGFDDGTWGASPGGAQDIGYVREVIESGGVPWPEDVFTEGLLSEHDLPTIGAPCEELMCLRPASAIAPDLGRGELVHWVHVGMTSGLSKTEFERPPVDIVVVVDKSASMSIDMMETRTAIHTLVDNLRPDDRLGLIAFDSDVHELRALAPVTDKQAIHEMISSINASGSWNLDSAVAQGYAMLEDAPQQPERLHRVMLLSCAYPALTGTDDFSRMVHENAQLGIGMSFFGVILGHSPPLADLLGAERGGSYHYLESLDRVEQVFDVDFDHSVTVLAYDLVMSIAAAPGYELLGIDGVPGGELDDGRFEIATAFTSSGDGGIVARFEAVELVEAVATLGLDYEPETALGFTEPSHQIEVVSAQIGDEPAYGSLGARKAVFLVNQAERMRAACDRFHQGDPADGRAILDELLVYMRAERDAMNQPDLDIEVALVEKLRANME